MDKLLYIGCSVEGHESPDFRKLSDDPTKLGNSNQMFQLKFLYIKFAASHDGFCNISKNRGMLVNIFWLIEHNTNSFAVFFPGEFFNRKPQDRKILTFLIFTEY